MAYTPSPPAEVTIEDVRARIRVYESGPGVSWKRSPERAFAIYNALRAGDSRTAAARAGGIDGATLYRWMADEPEFATLVEEGEAAAESSFVQTIFSAAAAGTWQAAAWWLERRRPALYGRRDRMDVTVDMRLFVESIAQQEGLNPDELLAGAMSIMEAHNAGQRLLGDGS